MATFWKVRRAGMAACVLGATHPGNAVVATTVRHGHRPLGAGNATLRRGQINNVGKRVAGNTPASGNEGVGEHVRTRFQIGPKAACGIAKPL